jgi:hypothetical protein
MARLANVFEGLLVLFLGTLVVYLLRHWVIYGCLTGMAICIIGLYVIGIVEKRRKKPQLAPSHTASLVVSEGASIVAAPGSAGDSVFLKIVKGATGPIGEAVRMSLPTTVRKDGMLSGGKDGEKIEKMFEDQ